MRVVVDLQAFSMCGPAPPMIDHYSASLACALLRHAGDHEVHIVINHSSDELLEKVQGKWPELFHNAALRVSRLPFLGSTEAKGRWHRAAAELVREQGVAQLKPDAVVCAPLAGTGSVMPVCKLRCTHIPTALALSTPPPTIGPRTNAEHRGGGTPSVWWNSDGRKQPLQSELALTVSEYSKRLLLGALELEPERVVVVPLGVDERFHVAAMPTAQVVNQRFKLDQDFILSIACGVDHEVERSLEAYALLPSELRTANRLAVVGVTEPDEIGRLLQLARVSGLAEGEVVFAGDVSADELLTLYNNCELLILPGWQDVSSQHALDAMSCGAPVLGPNHSGIPELLGLREALFEASGRHMSEKIRQVLTNAELRKTLKVHAIEQARRFSWRESARRSFEALEALRNSYQSQSQPRRSLAKQRPRMAYVSPLPPERSGIADYSVELLPELGRYYEIELITDSAQRADLLQRQFRRVPFTRFEKSARGYDRVLYHIGNSPLHLRIPSLLEHYPGPVVLHDFFLSGLFYNLEAIDGVSLWRNLYVSHGYPGLVARARKGVAAAAWAYPCNLAVLARAAGIIVHSEHVKQLASEWFGVSTESWKVIPQLRGTPRVVNRQKARRTLEIPPDTFLVCSFGFLAPSKLNDLLLQSWRASSLARLSNCRLVFVGGDNEGRPYRVNGLSPNQVRATGYLTRDKYELYLAAADVAVQLRNELSRGETPRSVLDCMAQGMATIVNAHPALDDLPLDSVLNLPASCKQEDLISALERLYHEPQYRAVLGRRAQQHVKATRSPALIARQYAEAVEEFANDHPAIATNRVVVNLAQLAADAGSSDEELATVASCIAENSDGDGIRQLLVDVTIMVLLGDSRTGIQRVTRAILAQLLENPPAGYRVEPVFRVPHGIYRYARKFVSNCLQLDSFTMEDAPVAVNRGDVFLGLDWDPGIGADHQAANWLRHHRHRGMRTFFIVHDLLPLRQPEWFEPRMKGVFEAGFSAICQVADGLICVSRAVADELSAWFEVNLPSDTRPLEIGYFHHGSNIEASWPSCGLTSDDQTILKALTGREVLVMIGTVEPRKGHSQALSAMEHLWEEGENLSLMICGKQGWMMESIAQRIRSHPELGHRLFWMEQATDEVLLRLYSIASGMLMASEGEGFGLPLIEAAEHGVPIIARDLPVFREVAGEHAFYFSGTHPTDLADALRSWLKLYRRGHHPKSNMLPRQNWQQSAEQLLQVLLEGKLYKRWQPPRRGSLGGSMNGTVYRRPRANAEESLQPALEVAYVPESSE